MQTKFYMALKKCCFLTDVGEEVQNCFLAKTMENQKKKFLRKKICIFISGTFWEQRLSHFFDFVDLRHKKNVFWQLFFSFHTIFQTKHVGMILTVQIFYINDSSSSKNLLYDLRTQMAHCITHFARGQLEKQSIKLTRSLIKSLNTYVIYLIFVPLDSS